MTDTPVAQPVRPYTLEDANTLLYGADPTSHIVAIEPAGQDRMRIYRRLPDANTISELRTFRPWLVTSDATFVERYQQTGAMVYDMYGPHPLNRLIAFPDRQAFRSATDNLEWNDRRYEMVRSATSQFLLVSGMTSFKEMVFQDLRRMQLDIETLGFNASDPEAQIIMVAIRRGTREHLIILESDEAALLNEVSSIIQEWDPDVIEGHNIFNFDLPFIVERARMLNVTLNFGRDGSPPMVSSSTQRFQAGPQSLPFTSVRVYGRHIIDTYQQIQRWDTVGRLSSYGLKAVIRELDLEREDRVFVAGDQIATMWRSGQRTRDLLAEYAMDDVRDVDLLSRITLPTEFYQAQIVPMAFQTSTSSGSGTKIDHLMLRAYLNARHSLPFPDASKPFPGGYVELIASGIFGPVVKCDVESLYPSIMLHHQITAKSDLLSAFPLLLDDLTQRRIHAKRQAATTLGEEHAVWNGLQATFKILINSFYGYLGYGRGRFNDFDAAEDITLKGQEIIQDVVRQLREQGASLIEVDTDGVYFSPPESVVTQEQEEAFIRSVSQNLPGRINLAHDGRYKRMLSLKIKNYALLDFDGHVSMTGSSLRSRRMEPVLRKFLLEAANGFLEEDRDRVREYYFSLAAQLQNRDIPVADLSQWMMLRESTIGKHPKIKRLLEAHPGTWRYGERLETYEREDGELGLVSEYGEDENTTVILRRLRDTAERFRELFESDSEFDAFFPLLKPTSDLDMARERKPVQQLGLFG